MAALVMGFLLGLKHATDADHVVAISAIATEYKNAWKGIWVGVSWGLGHTTPLLGIAIIILLFKERVLDVYEGIAPIFEFGVGVMLVFLGIQVYWGIRNGTLHLHDHEHDGSKHVHIHATHNSEADSTVEKAHGFFRPGKPFFRTKSYFIGIMHGLAGSAAVMLAFLPTISSSLVGVGYIALFGLGTILSMALITVMLGIPFAISGSYKRVNEVVSGVAGALSIIFGAALMSDVALGTHFLPV
ncbi:MAG: High-affinity nickel permease [Chloroflexi bacterium]|jgi:high-affinity nickel permease|nr:MAG: High-affinity nickel permease [Chloroflexota bacterium]